MFNHFRKIFHIALINNFNDIKNSLLFTLASLLTVITIACELATPVLLITILPQYLEAEVPMSTLLLAVGGYGVTWSLARVLPSIRAMLLQPLGTNLSYKLTNKVMDKYFKLPMEELESNNNAPALQHFGMAYEHIGQSFTVELMGKALPSAAESAAILGLLGYFYHYFALIGLGEAVIYNLSMTMGASWFISRAQQGYLDHIFATYEKLIAMLDQYENAHYYHNVKYELQQMSQVLRRLSRAINRNLRTRSAISAIQNIITGLGYTGMALLTAFYVKQKNYKLSDFFAITLLLDMLAKSLNNFADSFNALYSNYSNFKELLNYLDRKEGVYGYQNYPLVLAQDNANIEFQHVTFSYQDQEVFSDVSFTIEPQKTTVIVGLSGVGKSTIVKLLYGFYKPDSGHILIGGQEIADTNIDSVRKAMAIVPQNPIIFNTSLRENIRYGQLNAADEEIETAASYSGLNDLIENRGIDANVGEKGKKLSGGQRQRVAIARAYIRSGSPYLILDEPTSALDSRTEKEVIQQLNVLIKKQKKTTIVITHKLSTVMGLAADKVIVLHQGKVHEQGSLAELLRNKGLFAQQMQFSAQAQQPADAVLNDAELFKSYEHIV